MDNLAFLLLGYFGEWQKRDISSWQYRSAAGYSIGEAKAEFEAELEVLQTQQGIWNELTTLYILGRKPETSAIAEHK